MEVSKATKDFCLLTVSILLTPNSYSKVGAWKEFKFDAVMSKPNEVVQCYVGCEAIGICHLTY
jgi:hypothetical protein